ncbi:hypothetical protein [Patulibacter sp.]|uniref:hypothetical protein n=1 Tax=Patulibacter sp. TaxID=1912859 RepID=UPI0027182564|nr:hypothetical protein [Patulibacter sp.]MDO9406999.1 hypothetical protein [Patulibacter sp.]
MSRIIRTTVTAAVTMAVLAGTAGAAGGPVAGPQRTFTGTRAPVSVPGNHLHKGDRIPKGAVLISREVTSSGGSTRLRVVLTLPKGKRFTGLAQNEGAELSIQLPEGEPSYVGRRRTTVLVVPRKGHAGSVTVYGYAR